MSTRFVRGFVASLAFAALCAGCSSGSSGGGGAEVLSGSVLSPGGGSIGFSAGGGPRARRPRGSPPVPVQLPGLLPVPDGTAVELVRLDPLGNAVESFASTTTTGGAYAFDLTALGLGLASDLAVQAGSGATRLRALAGTLALDVDPLSEAVLGLMLQGAGLDAYTLQEAIDLTAATRLLAATQGLQAGADVPATVDLIEQAVLADPDVAAFFAAAAAPGQTSAGPGDIGDHFPGGLGDTWSFAGTRSTDRQAPVPFDNARRIIAIDLGGAQTVEESSPFGSGTAVREFLEETSTGIVNHGNDDPDDPLTPLVAPYAAMRFPLRPGDRTVEFDVAGVPLGQDLDQDGIDETIDARSERTTLGFEDVSVPAGTFADCALLERSADTTLLFSRGARGTATLSRKEWFAPGLGLVRAETVISTVAPGLNELEEFVEELVAYQVGLVGHGILPPVELTRDLHAAGSDADRPGRPGLACDGTNFLLATVRDLGTQAVLVGILVGPTGLVLEEFTILDVGGESGLLPAVGFDGTNYLVVFQPSIPGAGAAEILGVRVSPHGDVLDPAGFEISHNGGFNFDASVAFDGLKYMVVWHGGGDVLGAQVAPDGTVSSEFVVHPALTGAQGVEIVFGGGNFLVVWNEQPQLADYDVRGTRLSPTGVVLDPPGFDVAVTPLWETASGLAFDGARYLVVWSEFDTASPASRVLAARLELDGSPSDPAPIPITTFDPPSGFSPSVAFDGTNHLVVWSAASFDPTDGIYAKRLAPDGTLVDGPADAPGFRLARPAEATTRLFFPLAVRGQKNVFAAWLVNVELSGEAKDLAGALVYPF